MWTSKGATPDESDSARTTVELGTAAFAAATAFCTSVPVRSVSPGPWLIVAGAPGAPAGGVDWFADPDEPRVDELVAAVAIPPAPMLTAVASPQVTQVVWTIEESWFTWILSGWPA